MTWTLASTTAGLLLLIVGGELLVRGAAISAQRLGISPLLVGLVLVGFGTSTPELSTSVQASLAGSPGIAVGNIVGSNIANILFILGVAAMVSPVVVGDRALARDGSVMLASAAALAAIAAWWQLDRVVGLALLAALAAYLAYAYLDEQTGAVRGHSAAYDRMAAHEHALAPKRQPIGERAGVALPLATALAGLAIVTIGSWLLVHGATGIARQAGVSETLIGLTLVAIGTSLPELVASLVAAWRGHGEIALGNILGSNIYNTLGIGGVTAMIAPTTIPAEIARFDALVMLAAAVALFLFALTGRRIGRLEAALLLGGYAGYLYVLWPG